MLKRLLALWAFMGFGTLFAFLLMGVLDWHFILVVGGWAGATFWLIQDRLQFERIMGWMRRPITEPRVPSWGGWQELIDRSRKTAREHQRELAASDERLSQFLEAIQASPNGVVLLDPDGRIEWSNLTASEHLSLDPTRDRLQLIGNLLRDPVFTQLWHGQGQHDSIVIQAPNSSLSSRRRLSIQLFAYGRGRRLMLTSDVTQIELAEGMRQQFVANVSHEIRTPLTVILGFIDTLNALDLEAKDQRRYLNLMHEQANRMHQLVNDLLTLSKLEGSPAPSAKAAFPLEDLLDEAIRSAQALSETHARGQPAHVLRKQVDPALESAHFIGSRSEIQSAVSNLLNNAVRYSPVGRAIDVFCRVNSQGRLELSVQDQGAGIAEEHLPRLTERFYRVDLSRSRETGGTGLGLAIVKHVAMRHGGELGITSTLGKGSRFTLSFPLSRIMEHAPQDQAQSQA
jgi:two-component system phosphate regulon sensor histidine kinase PhoR